MRTYLTRKRWLVTLACFFTFPLAFAHSPGNGFGTEKSLEFVQNRNQWPANVKFKAELPGGHLYLNQTELVFSFQDQRQLAAMDPHKLAENPVGAKSALVDCHAYAMRFLGAGKHAKIAGERKTPGYRNYLLGNNPSKWASDVAAYEEVQYQDLYPGTSLKLYELNKKLKYDFELEPGANPDKIRIQYDGATKIALQNGQLVIGTSVNTVTEQRPYAYQIKNGRPQEVPCEFRLQNNVLSFAFPKGYNKKLPLIIDPTLVFSTYTGSFSDNWGFTATYDQQGDLYSGGVVFSSGYPVTMGAFQTNFQGFIDIAIIKYNPALAGAASRVYATYIGGTQAEAPHSLVVNSQNELLILGTTSSLNYPVSSNGFSRNFNGGTGLDPFVSFGFSYFDYVNGSDLIITKLSASGGSLAASTFLGGSGNDGLLRLNSPLTRNYGDQFRGDIFTDAADNVYIASSTSSQNYPRHNAFQTGYGGSGSDAVVTKLTPNLTSLVWSSYTGGSGDDAAFSVQVDNQQNTYICGGTTSGNLPQTAGGFKPTSQANQTDGFVSKISSTGQLLQSTYIGTSGSNYDQTYFVQLDGSNNVYVLGQSQGNYTVTSGVFSVNNGRQFIQKLNSSLTSGILSTRFGTADGKFNISPTAFLVDNCERIFVCGWGGVINTLSPNYVQGNVSGLPVTANAIQQATDGSDFYLMQLSQNATALEYATFLGGNSQSSSEHVDGGTSRFDKRGFVYQAVCGGCVGTNAFPTTPNAWSTINRSSNCNNAAFKFDFAVSSAIAGGAQKACLNGGPFQVTGASPPGGVWSGPGVSPSGIFTPTPALVGTQLLTYTVTVGSCTSNSTKAVTIAPTTQVSFTGLKSGVNCTGDTLVTLIPSVPGGTFSGQGVVNGNQWSAAAAGGGSHPITYTFTDTSGCTATFTDTAFVDPPVPVTAGPDEGVCAASPGFRLAGATPAGGTWSGPGVTPTGFFNPAAAPSGKNTLTYTVVAGKCSYTDTKIIAVEPVAEIQTVLPYELCDPNDSTLAGYAPLTIKFNNKFPVGESYIWDFGDGITSTEINPEHTYSQAGTYTVQLRTDYGRECVRQYYITQLKVLAPILPNVITPNGDRLNDTFVPKVTCFPMSLRIFSRWGNQVYETENYADDFDGKKLSAGLYYYLLKDTTGRSWKGWLEIVK